MRRLLFSCTLLLALPLGCDRLTTPQSVTTTEVDNAIAKGDYETACVGLKMKSDDLRTHTAQQLVPVPEPEVDACLCAALQGKDGEWDAAVAEGMRGADREETVKCLADLALKADLPRRSDALKALGRMKAPVARTTLAKVASEPGDSAVRAQAVAALAADRTQAALLIGLLANDADRLVRASAAQALGGLAAASDPDALAALSKAATGDALGEVRAQALAALRKGGTPEAVETACRLMMDDPSAAVRQAAVQSFHGTRKPAEVACLRKRAFTLEDDANVRQAILDTLKTSPSDDAAKVLCDAIPFWLRSYMVKGLPDQVPGTDVIRAQNDRDFERSYACVGHAVGGSGYSCYARQYVGTWFRELSGTAPVPKCPAPG